MIGRQNSTLSKNIDILLVTSVKQEACTLDLAPTASTTATLDQWIHTGDNILFVYADTSVMDALLTISDKGLGVTGVLNHDDELVGVITDSDIRRGLEKGGNNIFNKTAEFMMSKNTKWVLINTLAISALELMEKHSITSLFVRSDPEMKKSDGVIHIHDILKTGIQQSINP